MRELMQAIFDFFLYMIMAVFAQNAVFTRALGVSRLTKIVEDHSDTLTFSILLCCVQIISAPLGYLATGMMNRWSYQIYFRPLIFTLCAAVAFFVVLGVVVAIRKVHIARHAVAALPMATFNTCILGTLMVSATQGFDFKQTMGFAIGSGLGYVLAVQVVAEGQRKLDHSLVPEMFRGLPVTLLYIGILALAIYGLTGHTVTF